MQNEGRHNADPHVILFPGYLQYVNPLAKFFFNGLVFLLREKALAAGFREEVLADFLGFLGLSETPVGTHLAEAVFFEEPREHLGVGELRLAGVGGNDGIAPVAKIDDLLQGSVVAIVCGNGLDLLRKHVEQTAVEFCDGVLNGLKALLEQYHRLADLLADGVSLQSRKNIHMLSCVVEILAVDVDPGKRIMRFVDLLCVIAVADHI